jgi:hypothetical protein
MKSHMSKLSDKMALITGGTTGIRAATAKLFRPAKARPSLKFSSELDRISTSSGRGASR